MTHHTYLEDGQGAETTPYFQHMPKIAGLCSSIGGAKHLHGEVEAARADVALGSSGCGAQPVAELLPQALRQVSRCAIEELHRKPHHQTARLVHSSRRQPGSHRTCGRCQLLRPHHRTSRKKLAEGVMLWCTWPSQQTSGRSWLMSAAARCETILISRDAGVTPAAGILAGLLQEPGWWTQSAVALDRRGGPSASMPAPCWTPVRHRIAIFGTLLFPLEQSAGELKHWSCHEISISPGQRLLVSGWNSSTGALPLMYAPVWCCVPQWAPPKPPQVP